MAVDWSTLAVVHVLLGYEAGVLGFLRLNNRFSGYALIGDDFVAMMIIGFLFYTGSAILSALIKFAELKKLELIVNIINACMLFLAGLFIIIGIGLLGDFISLSFEAYAPTLEITAAALAWLACLFIILQIIFGKRGGGSGGSGDTRTAPAPET